LKPKLFLITFKHSDRTSKKAQPITKINHLMPFREMIAVYYENLTKQINTICGSNVDLFIVREGGTYSSHWALRG
jgi:hypothetical protein